MLCPHVCMGTARRAVRALSRVRTNTAGLVPWLWGWVRCPKVGTEDKTAADPQGCSECTEPHSPLVTLCLKLVFGNYCAPQNNKPGIIECTRDECSVPCVGVSMWPAWEGGRVFLTQLCSCYGPQGSQGDMQRGAEPHSARSQGPEGCGWDSSWAARQGKGSGTGEGLCSLQ